MKLGCTFGVAVCLAAGSEATADQGWNLRVTNSEGPVSRTCYAASSIPGNVRGSYFIAGPAQFNGLPDAQWKYQGVFDGLGMVNRFELSPADAPGKVCFTSAWMNTGLYKSFTKDHKEPPRGVLFEDTSPSRSSCDIDTDMCDYLAPNDNNWVNMIVIGDEAVWLSDVPLMIGMDPKTLNITGPKAWADDGKCMTGTTQPSWVQSTHMASGGSAHPLLLPGTKSTYVDFIMAMPMMPWEKSYYIDVFTFEASASGPQSRKLIASLQTDAGFYMHSFGVTEKHLVLPFNMDMGGVGPMHAAIMLGKFSKNWKGLQVLDIATGSLQLYDDMEPFEHAHIANTFENSSGIVFDVGAYDKSPFVKSPAMDINLFQDKAARDAETNRCALRRYHLNNVTKKTTVEYLVQNGRGYDFFKINPVFNGLPYCIYYAVEWWHDDKAYASMAVMKHDICQNKITYWSDKNVYVNEPFFIGGTTGAEDDGTLVFTALDGNTGKSVFVALEAQSFKELERVQLPSHIPFTAHGSFIPLAEAAEETVIV